MTIAAGDHEQEAKKLMKQEQYKDQKREKLLNCK